MTPLMTKGAKEYVTEQDIPSLRPEDEAEKLGNTLQEALKKQ
jgi:ATP-binding cassette, subfamily C (CFTR/MRP), member 1